MAKPQEYKLLSSNNITECWGPAFISIIFLSYSKLISFKLYPESYSWICICSKIPNFSTKVGWLILLLWPKPNCPNILSPHEYNLPSNDIPRQWPPPKDNFLNLIGDNKGIMLNFFELKRLTPFPSCPNVLRP